MMKNLITLGILLILPLFILRVPTAYAAESKYKIGAYYFGIFSPKFPAWQLQVIKNVYGRSNDWWGGVKDFYGKEPGVPQDTRGWTGDFSNFKPLIGYYDQSRVETLESHIAQAKNFGLDYFSFYWYWNSPTNSELYNDGLDSFLKANNKDSLHFMLTLVFDTNPPVHLTKESEPNAINTIINKYFSQANYLKTTDGRPVVFLYDTRGIEDGSATAANSFITLLRNMTKQKTGKEPFILLNYNFQISFPNQFTGFDGYSCFLSWWPSASGNSQPYSNYIDSIPGYYSHYVNSNDPQVKARPYMSCVTLNFDTKVRSVFMSNPQKDVHFYTGQSINLFKNGLQKEKAFMDARSDQLSKYLTIYAWNEWHEGSFLEPDVRDGTAYLQTVADVFSLPTTVQKGDIDANGQIDVYDYSLLTENFGKSGSNIPGNINKDSKVDIFDYNVLLGNFGK